MRHGLGAVALLMALCALPAPATAQSVTAGAGFGASALEGCPSDLRQLNQLFGWQTSWSREWEALRGADDAELREAIALWRTAPASLAADRQALRRRDTIKAPRIVVERVIEQVARLYDDLSVAPPLEGNVDDATRRQWNALFARQIRPAIGRYLAFLRNDYLPRANATPGIGVNAAGIQCFENAVTRFTTRTLTPDEIERIGNRILAETRTDLAALYQRPVSEVPQILAELRARRFEDVDRDEIVAISTAAVARARAAMPRMFTRPVLADVVVEPLPGPMENSFPAGFYRQARGAAPAAYVINLSRPGERRLMAEVIAFHETLPGHHIRAAVDYSQGEFNSGFLEGWGIYAEYFADEMGLYSADLDRAGMMAKHLWAASRLIIEPGLHARGWTRDQAVAFMRENTAMSEAEIALEVDRYIATPGQSLSYMLGYDMIAQARRDAERVMGARFDVRGFHDAVWAGGARPLDVMASDVHTWAAAAPSAAN